MLMRMLLWLRSNFLRRRLEREMREEMAGHLEQATSRLMARGMSAAEARRAALREFGNVPYLQEEARYARGTIWLDALLADARFALRHFARRPVTTVVMFVVLAVGMSISTLLFSYVHSYAVQPPPGVALRDDLVRIRGSLSAGVHGRGSRVFAADEFDEYRALSDHFAAVAGWTFGSVLVRAGEDVERRAVDARATFVTENYFSVLGVRPVLGPGLPSQQVDDPALAAVAVIGHTAWDQLFGRAPDVIGSTLTVNGVPVTVVGVAPERFNGVAGYARIQLWLPLSAHALVMREPVGPFRAVARLRPGVGMPAATAAVAVVAARAAAADDELRAREPSTDVVPLLSANGDPMFDRDVKLMTLLIGLLGLLVLLVTCTNVSALLTGLAAARRHEIAVRLSLGAARSRIIRQLLTESALLSCLAAAAALGIVWLVLRAATVFLTFIPLELGVSPEATTFTFAVALAVGVLFGLSPALHATRLAIATAMRDSTGTLAATRARLQRALVVAQIAFTQPLIVLLAAVLVLVLGEFRPRSATGFADQLVTLTLADGVTGSSATEWRQAPDARLERLLERLRATPGVAHAVRDASWFQPPLGSYAVAAEDRLPGTAHGAVTLSGEGAAPGWFRAHGMPLVRGQEFTEQDFGALTAGGDVAVIIGSDLARRLWPGADPLGRRLQPAADTATGAATLRVVGVVEDPLAHRGNRVAYRVWVPPDTGRASLRLLVRTAGAAQPLLPTLRTVVHDEMPDMVARLRTVAEVEDENMRRFRTITGGLMAAGVMALLLAALGLYALVAFSVGERTREIAVRIALGARGGQIVQRFVTDGLRLSAVGLLLGLPASLFGLHALLTAAGEDFPPVALPPVMAVAALGVLLVATAAVWIPARRAAAVQPAVALRRE